MGQACQALKFFLIGTGGTLAYAGIYLVLRRAVPQPVALVIAWLSSTLATNLAHRVVTFGLRDAKGRLADALVFLATSLLGLAITQSALLVHNLSPLGDVAVIVAATGVAGILRFAVMRWWTSRRASPAALR